MSVVDTAAVASWQAAVGRVELRREQLEREPLRRFALAIGADPEIGRTQPPLAHWAFFLPQPQDSEVGDDGHSRRGSFMPAIDLPSRMFAAAAIDFDAPLLLDQAAELASTIVQVTHKNGRSGELVFVEVDRLLSQGGSVRVRERQTYVYREGSGATPLPTPDADPIDGELWEPQPANLFRFSAATFNGHRIHYDLPYARDVENYPALIVHGPFTAAKLAGFAGREGRLASFSFRALAPLFLGQPVRLQREGGQLRAVRCDGAIAMTAEVTYK